jgi:hypothetical protein
VTGADMFESMRGWRLGCIAGEVCSAVDAAFDALRIHVMIPTELAVVPVVLNIICKRCLSLGIVRSG